MRFSALRLRKHFSPGVAISDHLVTVTGPGNKTTVGSVTYKADGTTQDQNGSTLETWLVVGASSNYEIRATLQYGTLGGTYGTWMSMGVDHKWSLSVTPGNDGDSAIFFEIRDASTHTTQDSATVEVQVYNT